MGVFHKMFLLSGTLHVMGTDLPEIWPEALGPLNCGQLWSFVWAEIGEVKNRRRRVTAISMERIILMSLIGGKWRIMSMIKAKK